MVAEVNKSFDVGEIELDIVVLRRNGAIDKHADYFGGLMNVNGGLVDRLVRG